MKVICIGCAKTPNQIEEYLEAVDDTDQHPDDYVREEEGTYNPDNGHFLCTECYIEAGMPTAPGRGWRAP